MLTNQQRTEARAVGLRSVTLGLQLLEGSQQARDIVKRCRGEVIDLDLIKRTEMHRVALVDSAEVIGGERGRIEAIRCSWSIIDSYHAFLSCLPHTPSNVSGTANPLLR